MGEFNVIKKINKTSLHRTRNGCFMRGKQILLKGV